MFVRHLFKQPILCCQQLGASPILPLRLPPVSPPVVNSLSHIHHRSDTDLDRKPHDRDILKICDKIQLIDAEGKYQGVKSTWDTLENFDRRTYRLICINPHVTEAPPICKLILKAQLEEERRLMYWAQKEKKNDKDPCKVVKTVEISWATAPNDLGHKIRKIAEFMQRGNRVDIVLGVKKGMAKQPLGKMVEMVSQIRVEVEQYGKEWKAAEGMIGVQYLIHFEGRRLVVEDPVKKAEVVEGRKEGSVRSLPQEQDTVGV